MKRSFEPEILDDFSIQDSRVDNALLELNIINKFLGGRRASYFGIKKLLKNISEKPDIKILDVGAGGSDSLIDFANDCRIYSLDKNKRACLFNRNGIANGTVCGDALKLPFQKQSFQISHASLFLHHFKHEEIKIILKELIKISKKGIIINDLQRSIFAYAGIKILTAIFSKSREVKFDGPLSVKRGFTRKDLKKILNELPLKNYEIKKMFAFRWLVIIRL